MTRFPFDRLATTPRREFCVLGFAPVPHNFGRGGVVFEKLIGFVARQAPKKAVDGGWDHHSYSGVRTDLDAKSRVERGRHSERGCPADE